MLFVVEYPGPPSGKNSKIFLKVFLREFDEVRSGCSTIACVLKLVSIH